MQKKLRTGIIGCGSISRVHMEGYKKLDFVEQVAFCDVIRERAVDAAKLFGAPGAKVFEDYRDMVKMTDLDAVDVCTENSMHMPIAIAALEAGKHVFCEKPMAITSQEADLMVKTAKTTGRKLTVGYQSRFTDDAQLLRRATEQGRLGKIYYAEAETLRTRGVPTWGVFLSRDKQGGGPLIDIGTHIVDLALWAMGDYSPVVSALAATYDHLIPLGGYNQWGPWDKESFEVEDSAFGTVILESGATLVTKVSWALNIEEPRRGVLLCGTRGGASLYAKGEALTLRMNGEADDRLWQYAPNPLPPVKDTPYDREMASWANCLINGTEPLVKPEEAAQVVRVLEVLYQSARSGRALNFERNKIL